MATGPDSLLRQYVALHNRCVESCDFSPLSKIFHPLAEMHFQGIALGPFIGREAILKAFQNHPPTARIAILEQNTHQSISHATYAWLEDSHRPAGRLHIEANEDMILRITISIDDPAG
jgi:hypothetical protein